MRRIALALLLWVAPTTGCACAQDSTQAGREALYAGRFEEARDVLRPLLSEPGGTVHAPLYFETYLTEGDLAEGLRDVEARLGRAPGDPYLLYAQGCLLRAMGRYDEAGTAFGKAVREETYRWPNAIELADLLEQTGRRSDARDIYGAIYEAYRQGRFRTAEDLTLGARAAARLGRFHDANDAFRTAYQTDPRHLDALYYWAELFREKYNEADARRTYEEALAVSAHRPELYVGLARSGAGFGKQEELARRALEINPNHVDALALLAELRILDGQYVEAAGLLEQARSVNPASIPVLAHLASAYHLQGDTERFAAVEQEALAINRRAGSFYLILAENAARRFRYPDAVAFARRAVEVDRDNPQAYATLGTSLLRTGETQEAQQYLQASFDADPFNLFAGNTLTLLEEYANFSTLESEHFRLLIHQSERDVLGPAMLDVAEAAYDSLSARYGYRPEGKILLEAYNDADDFAVRVAGVPHLGLLGVSFGDVVALNTPAAQAGSEYNWARTLWHELAHTMAIGVSQFHVPRWLTEGLSVYEEQRARPEWGREMDLELYAALDQGKLLPLAEIDRGFTRPTFPGQILLSYYHASKVIGYVAERYGFNAVVRILQALRGGADINASILQATGQDLAALDQAFRADLQQKRSSVAAVLAGMPDLQAGGEDVESAQPPVIRPDNPFFQRLQEGYALLEQKDYAAAEDRFRKALEIYPHFAGDGDPYRGLAEVYRAQGRTDLLMDVLERFLRISEHGAAEARELAGLYVKAGQPERAVYYFERSLEVEPYDASARGQLATLYEQQGRFDAAVRQRRALLALNPVDRANAYYTLAMSLHQQGQHQEARRAVLQALELAPTFREAQRLLLQVVESAE